MKKKFSLIELLIVIAIIAIVAGCLAPFVIKKRKKVTKSDVAIAAQQEEAMQEAVRQTGLPAVRNFQEKKMLKMLYELRDREDLVCHAYLVNQLNGKVGQYLGKCIGYGLPASTQYSNPEKEVHRNNYNGGSFGAMPQAEPNGLFMPEGLSATWLMMVDPETDEPRPVYVEPLIIVSPFKLH